MEALRLFDERNMESLSGMRRLNHETEGVDQYDRDIRRIRKLTWV